MALGCAQFSCGNGRLTSGNITAPKEGVREAPRCPQDGRQEAEVPSKMAQLGARWALFGLNLDDI